MIRCRAAGFAVPLKKDVTEFPREPWKIYNYMEHRANYEMQLRPYDIGATNYAPGYVSEIFPQGNMFQFR